MALYVTYQMNAPQGEVKEIIWHVGEKKVIFSRYESVIAITADGDELDEILVRFNNIPSPKHKRIALWRGEFAQFIWDNL